MKLLLFLMVVVLAGTAWAEAPDALFARANEAFRRTEFEQAIPLYRELLNPPLLSPSKIAQARMRLSESLFFTQHQADARRELHALLGNDPNLKTDASVPPDFAEFFAATKRDFIVSAAPKKKTKPDALKPDPLPVIVVTPMPTTVPVPVAVAPVTPPPPADIPVVTHWHAPPWYLKIIPLGVGQFANHDPVAGGVFLSLEVAFVATNVVTTLINDKERSTYGGFRHAQPYPALYDVQLGSAIALYATLAVGLIDAFVWSPGRGERRMHASVSPTVDGRGAAAVLNACF